MEFLKIINCVSAISDYIIGLVMFRQVSLFNGILTFVVYLIPNSAF